MRKESINSFNEIDKLATLSIVFTWIFYFIDFYAIGVFFNLIALFFSIISIAMGRK